MRPWVHIAVIWLSLLLPRSAYAGMPSVLLHDVARMRIQTISFFLLVLLLSTWGIQNLWNKLSLDFPKLPRLTYSKALAAVCLWGLLFVIVLTMISGARELMTPGAWEKQGATYQLKESAEQPAAAEQALLGIREATLQKLSVELLRFAATHDGRYPTEEETSEIDDSVWQLPQRSGARYLYKPGLMIGDGKKILAVELDVYDDEQFVLLDNGDVRQMTGDAIQAALKREVSP